MRSKKERKKERKTNCEKWNKNGKKLIIINKKRENLQNCRLYCSS